MNEGSRIGEPSRVSDRVIRDPAAHAARLAKIFIRLLEKPEAAAIMLRS